ncbi:MAG: hypothetical protein WCY25_02010 [Moheibacter sp.]
MKKVVRILSVFLIGVAAMPSAKAQDKTEILDWLRSHLKTVVVESDDSDLKSKMTKTYTFYDDAFVVKTAWDFEDKAFNGPPYFAKIWYADMISGDLQDGQTNIYILSVAVLYTRAGTEKESKEHWYSFQEPTEIELYLTEDKELNREIIAKLMKLQALNY